MFRLLIYPWDRSNYHGDCPYNIKPLYKNHANNDNLKRIVTILFYHVNSKIITNFELLEILGTVQLAMDMDIVNIILSHIYYRF